MHAMVLGESARKPLGVQAGVVPRAADDDGEVSGVWCMCTSVSRFVCKQLGVQAGGLPRADDGDDEVSID